MPKRHDIHKIMIIGSGPIVIGQACEFDYSGTQACKALREEGFEIVLVNSNPATIMTDPEMADKTYIEPIIPEICEKIIEKERPDALLPTLGGQTGLNISVELAESKVLERFGVEMIGAKLEAIKKAEDRELFKKTMENAGVDLPKGRFAYSLNEAVDFQKEIGYPSIIRPSFTLGGTGGGIARDDEEFNRSAEHGLHMSPINEILIEESVIGWKEFELEVMRDLKDNVVIVCSIENLDPMGVHTGDSITVAPAQTLTDKEYQLMRDAAIRVIREIGVETGGSNIQFAVNPEDGRMVIIEMNPRVSRSSALASKATGFPIAKMAAKLAVGYTLDEIRNDITRETPASFEPTIDYCVVKLPRWAFEKFPGAKDELNIQMKSVGETMAIGRTFKEALQKGLRSLEIGRGGLGADGVEMELPSNGKSEFIRHKLEVPNAQRIFYIREAFQSKMPLEEVHELTKIDPWFLGNIQDIVLFEEELALSSSIDKDSLLRAKQFGFSDRQLASIWRTDEETIRSLRVEKGIIATFKTVDTCAAEFEAYTPYHYSTYESECEVVHSNSKKKIVILGSGPNRIGQGIEFDYCCVHASFALKEDGFETIMVNSNPETVSTDYDTSDKLYFEPLTVEDVLNIVDKEDPDGVIVQFGGQTPLNLAIPLERAGVKILGTSPDSIDLAEDRKRFGALIEELGIRQPENGTAGTFHEARKIAADISYPVLVRPSYVLGGRAMVIVHDEGSLERYMHEAVRVSPLHPVLIDKFLEDAYELDVDAVCDENDVFIGGIMEHVEGAGIHSGDSACVVPPNSICDREIGKMKEHVRDLAKALKVVGLMNVQYAVKNKEIYVLEVNPRASRTVPFISKAIGVPLAKIAARVMVGKTLKEQEFTSEVYIKHTAVKEAVLPFIKFSGADSILGPEMKSTGEVMGIDTSFGASFLKAQLSAGFRMPLSGKVFMSVSDKDKASVIPIARKLYEMGFKIVATEGTYKFLKQNKIPSDKILKVHEGSPNILDAIRNDEIDLMINTPYDKRLGEMSQVDDRQIRRAAIMKNVTYTTTISGAAAVVSGVEALRNGSLKVKTLQEYHKEALQVDGEQNS